MSAEKFPIKVYVCRGSGVRTQEFKTLVLENGVTLLAEEIEGVSSAAVAFLVPAGSANDPSGYEGSHGVLTEMLFKGAGKWNSRELSGQFEDLGVHHSQSAGIEVSMFSGSMIAEKLPKALELFREVLLNPTLPKEELESVRELALQDLEALEDEPASKIMTELAKRFYPHPFGRSQLGTAEGLKAISLDNLREVYEKGFRRQQLIIAISGKFNWSSISQKVSELFQGWQGSTAPLEVPPPHAHSRYEHIQQDTAQVQIALAYPSVSFGHPEYYTARVGVGVLSGGMAGRLFIEVREKRGLVYRVGASHSAARGRAAIFAFAGTTPDNAQTTTDVMLGELRKLADGVTEEELSRAKVELKSSLIMQSEHSSARASALVNDWWNLRRLRSLEEIRSGIEKVSNEDIRRHLQMFPVSPVTLVTLGSKGVEFKK